MGDDAESPESVLNSWYTHLSPSRVDLIGDIAGKEPFLIHGESLIRHCLEESPANFQDGFQLLHAVYFVEKFLSNLQRRGCDFDVVFFRNLRDLCVPYNSGWEYKYQLARTIIIKHLQRHAQKCAKNGARASVLEFDSPFGKEFAEYLNGLPIHFVLCHDGVEYQVKDTTVLRYLIRYLISKGKNVAVINALQWKSSKAYAPLLSRSSTPLMPIPVKREFDSPFIPLFDTKDGCIQPLVYETKNLTVREHLGIAACLSLLRMHKDDLANEEHFDIEERIQAFLLHLAVLKHCTLLERQHWVVSQQRHPHPEDDKFLRHVIEISWVLLNNDEWMTNLKVTDENWDLYDAFDGFLFHFILKSLRAIEWLPNQIIQSWQHLWSAFRSGTNANFSEHLPELTNPADGFLPRDSDDEEVSALPFSHPVLNGFLQDIKLKESQDIQDSFSSSVFEDLHHWHNTKLLIPTRKIERLGFFARKKKQGLLASMVAYSASLTNAKGKLIDPEIIIVKKQKATNKPNNNKNDVKNGGKPQPQPLSKKPGRNANKPGGKESAFRAAQEVQEQKASAKRNNTVTLWGSTCWELEKEHSLLDRYLKALKFLAERTKADNVALGSEVHLYLCHILGQLWAKARANANADSNASKNHQEVSSHKNITLTHRSSESYLIAIIWKWLQEMRNTEVSKEVHQAAQKLTNYLEIPCPTLIIGNQTQKMSFKFDYSPIKGMKKIMSNYREMQLEYAAPYMDRRFNSQQDQRVPFDPDGWQVKVLDSIDANNSLLVIAPTSAGKTFISFYAMKKILEESDDGVLVYVVPTKALVNQIAAEIGARFTKSYHKQAGKSVWAIYTRDYRLHSPTGCQILVTVPHMLQILLLAPTNAKGPNAWSRRIKRIIFDEVHCIGQDADGVVWEQLLLSAPCPVIALSATIGNPEPFREWLSQVQQKKGLKLDMVVHTARYSDLRKFIHVRQERDSFQGLRRNKSLPVPGLDEGEKCCTSVQFIHPVAALTERARTALDDLSLEARDCLRLWESMKKVLSDEDVVKFGVPDPSTILPETISKSDVLRWEVELKQALRCIIESPDSAFQDVRKLLEPPLATEKKRPSKPEARYIDELESMFDLAVDLHNQGALPALVFHYDTHGCEDIVRLMLSNLVKAEKNWKNESSEWAQKLKDFEAWEKAKSLQQRKKPVQRTKGDASDGSRTSKLEQLREEADADISPWESFKPNDPLEQFNFADTTKMQMSEVLEMMASLQGQVSHWLLSALRRGLGVHHAGLNREYRQT
ncbi:hypothetical protein ACSS6W_006392 [Trichoderma asperelloides]